MRIDAVPRCVTPSCRPLGSRTSGADRAAGNLRRLPCIGGLCSGRGGRAPAVARVPRNPQGEQIHAVAHIAAPALGRGQSGRVAFLSVPLKQLGTLSALILWRDSTGNILTGTPHYFAGASALRRNQLPRAFDVLLGVANEAVCHELRRLRCLVITACQTVPSPNPLPPRASPPARRGS